MNDETPTRDSAPEGEGSVRTPAPIAAPVPALVPPVGARVLIVEGLPELRSLLVERFEREGFEVHSREDAVGGLAAALELTPRLIVVNEKVADAAGTPLADRLRGHERTTGIPLIVLTARPVSAAGEAPAAEPAPGAALRRTAQLALPFRPQELIELAREAL